MNTSYTLYGTPGSGSFAVQVALEEIGSRFERIWVGSDAKDLAKYREINPTGKVPALVLADGTVIFESAAMIIHLAQAHPAAKLAPLPGTPAHALFLQWMVFLSANVYEAVLRVYYSSRYSSRGEADAVAIRQQGLVDLFNHLSLISEELAPYVLGAECSIADVYLHMLAGWWPDDRQELHGRLPKLGEHAALIAARPAVEKVQIDHTR